MASEYCEKLAAYEEGIEKLQEEWHIEGGRPASEIAVMMADFPTNREEQQAAQGMLGKHSNYPLSADPCFTVGIMGGCGPECFWFCEGNCQNAWDVIEEWGLDNDEEIVKLYDFAA